MLTIQIYGWETSFQKVQFTKLMQSRFDYGLRDAKDVTDAIVDDRIVEVEIAEEEVETVLASMRELGAMCAVLVKMD